MAQPFKGNQFKLLSMNTGSQKWMEPEQELANKVVVNSKAHLLNFQEVTPEALAAFAQAAPYLQFNRGRAAGDILINSQAYDTRRFKLIRYRNVWLTKDGSYGKLLDAGGERGFTAGHYLDLNTDKELLMINVHLDNIGTQSRIESVQIILRFVRRFLRRYGVMPVIIAGDFNMSIDSKHIPGAKGIWLQSDRRKPYDLLTEVFYDCWKLTHNYQPQPYTYHGFQGLTAALDDYDTADTDRVFSINEKHTDGRKIIVHNMNILYDSFYGRFASDHFPLVVHLELV